MRLVRDALAQAAAFSAPENFVAGVEILNSLRGVERSRRFVRRDYALGP